MNRRILQLFVALLAGAASLPAELNPPQIGLVRYSDGAVASVYGLSGNYIVRPSSLPPADALSSSSGGILVSKDGRISLLKVDLSVIADYQSGEKLPVLNIDERPESAIAWLPGQQALLYWNARAWTKTPAITQIGSAHITSVWRRDLATAGLLAETPEGAVWDAAIALNSGELTGLTRLPGVRSPAFHSASYVIFQEGNTLHLQSPDNSGKTFQLGSDEHVEVTFERLSPEDIHIASKTPGQDWILHVDKTGSQITELPGKPQTPVPAREVPK